MATKPTLPRGPTDEELVAVGEVTPEAAPLDTLPLTAEERRLVAEATYARDSLVKEASSEAAEARVESTIIEAELERLQREEEAEGKANG